MSEYTRNAVAKFESESGRKLSSVQTPFIPDADWARDDDIPGRFAASCASHAATCLYLGRVGRPDISVPVQRLCGQVSKWTVIEDQTLIRLISYLACHTDCILYGKLAPCDLFDLTLRLYTDADWNGDATTTRSTSGVCLELHSPSSGRCWPICWVTGKQTSTSSSTAESEVVAFSACDATEYPCNCSLKKYLAVSDCP